MALMAFPLKGQDDQAALKGSVGKEGEAEEKEEIDLTKLITPWTEEDLNKLRTGELVPGEDFFGPAAMEIVGEGFLMPDLEGLNGTDLLDEGDLPQVGPELISERVLEMFFGRRPARYLSDPQGLLSEQVYGDRAGFLDYHAGDSEIDLYVYLFAKDQLLPPNWSVQTVFDQHFSRSGRAAVVFYWIGAPQRAKWAVSESVKRVISERELEVALTEAVDGAFRKSDPADQLDGFNVQLSNRLHWIENTMKVQEQVVEMGAPAAPMLADEEEEAEELVQKKKESFELTDEILLMGAAILAGLLLLCFVIWKSLRVRARRAHKLKKIMGEVALGASEGAGVGAVISFSSTRVPPSLQREQVPNEIER